ncbi:bestrophin-like domain [Kitasatospora griseola]|uniref:bestrophin-like domain n=1 Tax=Kitasatospora griseola TaxID=2064 RepID=UPI00364D63B4
MNWVDGAILVGMLVGTAACMLLVQRYASVPARVNCNDVAGFIFAAVGAFYAVLVAFVVIVVWENTSTARATTFEEADELAGVYWMSRQMPLPEGAQLEGLTLSYAHAVVNTEWQQMTGHHSDPAATALMYQVRDTALAFQPNDNRESTIYQNLVQHVDGLASKRRARLNLIADCVPPLLWAALIAGAVVTIAFTFLFGLSNTWVHLMMVLSLAGLIGLSLIAIKEMNYPFDGANSVKSTAFEVFLARLPPPR